MVLSNLASCSGTFPNSHLGERSRSIEGGLRKRGIRKSSTLEPLITVITVTYNSASSLEDTILSVLKQSYSNIEYIIIDGGSQDGTLDIIKKYDHAIDYWASEPDKGIYDAMNKGILLASGEWLNFLNAKDIFCEPGTIDSLAKGHFRGAPNFIYSDILLTKYGTTKSDLLQFECSHETLTIHHQASVYRRSLHLEHGMYLVAPNVTISDYLFFSLVDQAAFQKIEKPIAIVDTTGISQSQRSVEQKFIIDYLVNGMSKHKFVLYFHFFYYYREAKAALMQLWRRASP
jgi:glycosyltransferase involved in cell wall biosynthesis